MQHVTQIPGILRRKVIHASEVSSAADQDFKWPDRPEGHHNHESIIFKQQTLPFAPLDIDVVTEEASVVLLLVRALSREFFAWFHR
jgi:hypothetical protein